MTWKLVWDVVSPESFLCAVVLLAPLPAIADQKSDAALRNHIPKPGFFPPEGAGVLLDGDLVASDPINRRGALNKGPYTDRHHFAMLPYGMVRYHGAPADIRDLPPETHLHGRFLLPMEGEEQTIPHRNHAITHNHAILLEDNVSFYSRQGRSWKVVGIEQRDGPAPRLQLFVEPVGPEIDGGINKPTWFDIDDATRIWQDCRLVKRDQIKPGQNVQVNLTRGAEDDALATTDIWVDEASLAACKEIQRQRHLRLIRSRTLPGWIDAVKNNDTGGGEMTITFFGGMDPSLYFDIRDMKGRGPRICTAENTLRTWTYHNEWAVPADVLEWKETEDPPLGSSGIQVKVSVAQMLDGFRPGRVVRARGPWNYVQLTRDEYFHTPEALDRSRKLMLP